MNERSYLIWNKYNESKTINIRLQEITRTCIIILNYSFRIIQYAQGIKV